MASKESDPEGRNNTPTRCRFFPSSGSLNEVRPRRPEQSVEGKTLADATLVSMKSGLEGRNNKSIWDGITSAFESQ